MHREEIRYGKMDQVCCSSIIFLLGAFSLHSILFRESWNVHIAKKPIVEIQRSFLYNIKNKDIKREEYREYL